MPNNVVRVFVYDLRDSESETNPQQFDGSALICTVMKYQNGQGTNTVVITVGEEMEIGMMLADIIRFFEDAHAGFTEKLLKTIQYQSQVHGEYIKAG